MCYMLEINLVDICTLYFTQYCQGNYLKKDKEMAIYYGTGELSRLLKVLNFEETIKET